MFATFVVLVLALLGLYLLSAKRPLVKAIGYLLSAVAQLFNAHVIREDGYQVLMYCVWVFIFIFLGAAAGNFIKALSASKTSSQTKEDGK